MLHIYSIVDKLGKKSTIFVAENDSVAKRNFLLNCCQSPFWNDFELLNTDHSIHDDGTISFGDAGVYSIKITQDEIDSFLKALERQKSVRMSAYSEVKHEN